VRRPIWKNRFTPGTVSGVSPILSDAEETLLEILENVHGVVVVVEWLAMSEESLHTPPTSLTEFGSVPATAAYEVAVENDQLLFPWLRKQALR